MKSYDVVIVGGGPGGLSAALAFGRGRAEALLVDGGTPRNARAHQVHTFLTRDGTPPSEFRRIAREELAMYASVEVRDALVTSIEKLTAPDLDGCAFAIALGDAKDAAVRARRVLLAVGMRDELPPIAGLAEFWGTSVFQCPYCHGWELRDRPWGAVVTSDAMAGFAPFLSNWASHLTLFTNGSELSEATLHTLRQSGLTLETEPIARLVGARDLESVELLSGRTVPCSALVMRPPQRQVDLVMALGLSLDEQGFVRVDPQTKESSTPGIHVIGDATTMQQAAIMAAAAGMGAAAAMNHALVMERMARAAASSSR
ncbi:NAD(P)/FAD-dependent oxidoreductase [Pendulispora albinea]|uniref:NAD(P)/FAD-dependent oxidoreductase n=1 Tax=Pendulispora albinea TaxID=2741071 RepID=A0ABZ2LX45_9BACT